MIGALTPAVSIFVDCESEEELERLYSALAADGENTYATGQLRVLSQRFGWGKRSLWCLMATQPSIREKIADKLDYPDDPHPDGFMPNPVSL